MPGGKHGGLTVEDYDDFYEEDYDDEDDYAYEEAYKEGFEAKGEAIALPKSDQGDEYVNDLLAQLVPGLQQAATVDRAAPYNSAGAAQGTAAAGASALARFISEPPPRRPNGKQQKAGSLSAAATVAKQTNLAPPSHPAAAEVPAYQFQQPSPDDQILRAQTHRHAGPHDPGTGIVDTALIGSPTSAYQPSHPSSRPPTPSDQAHPRSYQPPPPSYQPPAHSMGQVMDGDLDDDGWQKLPPDLEQQMQAAALAEQQGVAEPEVSKPRNFQITRRQQESAGSKAGEANTRTRRKSSQNSTPAVSRDASPERPKQRPLSEYVMEPELRKKCQEAAAADKVGQGGRTKLHLVVLGHVDAGKSTLMGRLLHELGHVSQKVVHKHQKEAAQAGKASFAWAWLLDERPQERERGVTIDVASAHFETPGHTVTLLDAPGHRDFVPNMITGAAQADAALLLVDGSTGGFEAGFDVGTSSFGGQGGGQTREHAQLARCLGIEQMAVVVSKLDTCEYSQARFEAIKAQLLPFLKQCGFRESSLQWLPAVGPANQNLTQAPQDPQLAAWWKGPCLVQAIDAFKSVDRNVAAPLRMPINDIFKGTRGGESVGGKLEAGAIKVGTRVAVMPSGQEGTIKGIEMKGKAVELARAGDSADITLAGINSLVLGAGAIICHPDWPVPVVSRFEARVVVLDVPIVIQGQKIILHAHAASESGNISQLTATLDPKTGEQLKAMPRMLVKGQTAVVELSADRPMCLELYSNCRPLGRLALREGSQTLAVGIVTAIIE